MRYIKYPLSLAFGIFLVLSAMVGTSIWSLGKPIEAGRWVAECLAIKHEAALIHPPKLVILAGSNAMFGYSARRFTETYGVDTINAAVHAGLGIRYILRDGRRYFGKGRLFVLPLEYELYGSTIATPPLQYQVVGFDSAYFWSMGISEQFEFLRQISLDDRIAFLRNTIWPYSLNQISGYQSRTLNKWGDETADRTTADLAKAAQHMPSKYTMDDKAWDEIAAFAKDANAANCRIVLAYPNIYAKCFDFEQNKSFVAELTIRAAALKIDVIGRAQESIFGSEVAYDAMYHQNSQGQLKSTDRLYADLKMRGEL